MTRENTGANSPRTVDLKVGEWGWSCPAGESPPETVWHSSDEKVVAVNEKAGEMYAAGVGEAPVIAGEKAGSDEYAVCYVRVAASSSCCPEDAEDILESLPGDWNCPGDCDYPGSYYPGDWDCPEECECLDDCECPDYCDPLVRDDPPAEEDPDEEWPCLDCCCPYCGCPDCCCLDSYCPDCGDHPEDNNTCGCRPLV